MPRSSTRPSEQLSSKTAEYHLPASKHENALKGSLLTHPPKLTCLCAPTTHAGSFRCRLHRAPVKASTKLPASQLQQSTDTRTLISNQFATRDKRLLRFMSKHSAAEDSTKTVKQFTKPAFRHEIVNKPKTPSRLSKVIFARDIKVQEETFAEPEMPTYSWQSRPSRQIVTMPSKLSSTRLVAMKKCQGESEIDLLRLRVPRSTYAPPIISA